tara:strand:- start:1100 stop:1636 length:537 start_codon:yes stop_codon:yes gene_type:complete
MSLSLIKIASALADLVPGITKWFSSDSKKSQHNHNIAKKVIDIAKKVTGSSEASHALRLLESDPEALLDFQREIQDMERDLERAYLQDRQDARYRDMAFVSKGRSNTRADIMVVAAAVGLLSCLISLAVFRSNLPGEAVGIISTIAGIFGSCLKDAYSFEFGSSRGSKAKDLASFMRD